MFESKELLVRDLYLQEMLRKSRERQLIKSITQARKPYGTNDRLLLFVGRILTGWGLALQRHHGSRIEVPADYYSLLRNNRQNA